MMRAATIAAALAVAAVGCSAGSEVSTAPEAQGGEVAVTVPATGAVQDTVAPEVTQVGTSVSVPDMPVPPDPTVTLAAGGTTVPLAGKPLAPSSTIPRNSTSSTARPAVTVSPTTTVQATTTTRPRVGPQPFSGLSAEEGKVVAWINGLRPGKPAIALDASLMTAARLRAHEPTSATEWNGDPVPLGQTAYGPTGSDIDDVFPVIDKAAWTSALRDATHVGVGISYQPVNTADHPNSVLVRLTVWFAAF